jgi:hypothetical protein
MPSSEIFATLKISFALNSVIEAAFNFFINSAIVGPLKIKPK